MKTLALLPFLLLLLLLPLINPVYGQGIPCSTNNRVQGGLISTPNDIGSKFFNTSGNCVAGGTSNPLPEAALGTYKLSSYADLKVTYYDRAKPPYQKAQINAPGGYPSDQSYLDLNSTQIPTYLSSSNGSDSVIWVNANLAINSALPNTMNRTGVIFVQGNLAIHNDIIYPYPTAGLVFVVAGNIYIDAPTSTSEVKEVDAVLVFGGTLCTAAQNLTCDNNYAAPVDNNPLIINGSIIALPPSDQTITNQINFRRSLYDNSIAAEQIVDQPKYLFILRNLFTQTLQLEQEGTYAGTTYITPSFSAFTINPSSGHPPNNVYYTGDNLQLSWTILGSDSCTATTTGYFEPNFNGTVSSSGTASVSPTAVGTADYQLNCTTASGSQQKQDIKIPVTLPPPTPTMSVNGQTYNPVTVNRNTPYTLAWSAVNSPTSCSATCSAPTGGTCSFQGSTPPSSCSGSIASGSCTYSTSVVGDYLYQLTCVNGGNPGSGQITARVIDPYVQMQQNGGGVITPGLATVSWFDPSPQNGDYIAIFSAGAPNTAYISKLVIDNNGSLPGGCSGNVSAGSCPYYVADLLTPTGATDNNYKYLPKGSNYNSYEVRYISGTNGATLYTNVFNINN